MTGWGIGMTTATYLTSTVESPHHPGMNRRRFLLTSLAGAVAPPLGAGAQHAGKVPRIGILGSSPVSWEAFRQALRELGYVEGRNIVLEFRWLEGAVDRAPAVAAELVNLKV